MADNVIMRETEAESIAALAVKAAGAQSVELPDGRRFLLVPQGFEAKEVSDPHGLSLTLPRYVKQTVLLETVDSLVDYANRYRSADTLLFGDIAANSILALIDYHPAPGGAGAHVAHKAKTVLPFAQEWALWTGISGRLMEQLEFARFVEENAADVVAPKAADLLDAMRDLQAHRKVNFTKAVRTQSENENFEYSNETELRGAAKGAIEIPRQFELRLPVYFGEPTTPLFAFLRWKLDPDKGGLQLGIALHRHEHVRQAVFKQIMTSVGERTSCPVVFGKPA